MLLGVNNLTTRWLLILGLFSASIITGCGGNTSSVITLTFSPTTLPAGPINTPYSQTIKAGGGSAPYAYVVTSGALPTGLKLAATTGVISGTPTTDGTYRFTVFSTDVLSNSGYQAYSVVISGPLPLSPPTLPAGTLNTAYSQTIKASGGVTPYAYAVTSGTLPAGLILNASTGLISGTPTMDGTDSFKVTVTDSASNTGSQDYSVVISGPLPISPTSLTAGTLNTAYSQTLTANGGVAPYTYAVTSGALPVGWTLNASTGVISGTPTTDSTYAFTITATDAASNKGSQGYSEVISGPLPITPSALPAGTLHTAYTQIISASGGVAPYIYAVTSGALPVGLTLNASTGMISGTPTMDGTDSFTITTTDSASNSGSKGYAVVISGPLPISPTTLPAGTVNTAYNQTITASSGAAPYTYTVTAGGLPAGLTLDASTGVISGTPTTSATYGFTITATDSTSNSGSQGYSVVISGGLTCTTTVTSTLDETNPYSQTLSISYSMVGGGGGAGNGSGYWAAGGGGGSSAILQGTTAVNVANGGNGGVSGFGGPDQSVNAGADGTVLTGSFTLPSGTNLTVDVGAGGGGGGFNFGGGGGSGYFGGAGGGTVGYSDDGGGGGSTTGGIAASDGSAQNGGSLFGGYGGSSGAGAGGGTAGTGGAAGSTNDGGGGGGGLGGGGGSATYPSGSTLPTSGGSNGASANASGTTPGGLGANTWSSSTTLPVDAGAGASSAAGQGGNGGLVILQYVSPTGTCLL